MGSIQISSKLVNQLVGDEGKVKKKTKKPKPKISHESEQPQSKVKPASIPQKSSSGGGWPLQPPPMFLPISPPTPPLAEAAEVEAIRSILRDSEKVLEKLAKRESVMLEELTQRAKELHEKEFKLPFQNPMPCVAEREACLKCYKENLKEPLKCAGVVKTFDDCARRTRQQQVSSTGSQ